MSGVPWVCRVDGPDDGNEVSGEADRRVMTKLEFPGLVLECRTHFEAAGSAPSYTGKRSSAETREKPTHIVRAADLSLVLPGRPKDYYRHGWQSYVCLVDSAKAPKPRNAIMEDLLVRGVNTRPGTHAVHMLGYYRERFELKPGDFPVARDCDAWSMAIPLHNRMSADDYAHVVRALHEIT